MYLSGGHKTVKNILKRGAFTVSMGDAVMAYGIGVEAAHEYSYSHICIFAMV